MTTDHVSGVEALQRKLRKLGDAVPATLTRARLADFLVRRMQERFLQEVDPDNRKWRALSPKTKAGPQILVQTGNLFKAIGVTGADRGGFASATGVGFRIGIKSRRYVETSAKGSSRTVDTAVYGRSHQLGLGRVPQRRFIGIGKSDVVAVDSLIRRELRKAIKGL